MRLKCNPTDLYLVNSTDHNSQLVTKLRRLARIVEYSKGLDLTIRAQPFFSFSLLFLSPLLVSSSTCFLDLLAKLVDRLPVKLLQGKAADGWRSC